MLDTTRKCQLSSADTSDIGRGPGSGGGHTEGTVILQKWIQTDSADSP